MVDFDFGKSTNVSESAGGVDLEGLISFAVSRHKCGRKAVKKCKGEEADGPAGVHNQYLRGGKLR